MQTKVLFFLFFWLLNGLEIKAIEPNDDQMVGEMLNIATNQQLLSQRICKAYLAQLLELDIDNQKKIMERDISEFESNQKNIKQALPTKNVVNAIENVDIVWLEFKPFLTKMSKENAVKLLEINNSLFRLSAAVASQVQDYGKKFGSNAEQEVVRNSYEKNLALIIKSGEQRSLSQKMLSYLLAEKLDLNKNWKNELNKTQNKFRELLTELENNLGNSPEIDYTLVRLTNDWKRFETLCVNVLELKKEELLDLINIADILQDGMNEISKLYEEQVDDELSSVIFSGIVERAYLQATLCQQIAKAAVAEYMEISPKIYQKELKNAIDLFNQNLKKMAEFAPIAKIETELEQIKILWKVFEKIAKDKNTFKNCTELLNKNTALYQACNAAAQAIEKFAVQSNQNSSRFNSAFAHLISQSSRQRSLSQRVMLYCLAATGGFKSEYLEEYLNQSSEEYTETLMALLILPQNTAEINKKLSNSYKKWQQIVRNCEKATVARTDQQNETAKQNEELISEMATITKLYENLVSKMLIGEALNKAGRQRMLSQRMCKNYIALLMNVDSSNQKKQLDRDIILFDNQLTELRDFVANDELNTAFQNVSNLWKPIKTVLSNPPSENGAKNLAASNLDLLNACNQVVALLEKNNGIALGSVINIAGSQRAFSQRLMLNYMFYIYLGKKNNDYLQETLKCLDDFGRGLATLSAQKVNTQNIKDKIASMQRQYNKLLKYRDNLDKMDFYQIWLITDILLAESENLTKSYEQISIK